MCSSVLIQSLKRHLVSSKMHPFYKHFWCPYAYTGPEKIIEQKPTLFPSFYLNTVRPGVFLSWYDEGRLQKARGRRAQKVWQHSWPYTLAAALGWSPDQWSGYIASLAIGMEAGNGKQFWHWQPGVLPFANTFDVHTWSLGCCCWGPSVGMASCLIKWCHASFTGTWNRCQTKRVWFYFYYSEFKAHANTNPPFNTAVVPVKPSFFTTICQLSTTYLGA